MERKELDLERIREMISIQYNWNSVSKEDFDRVNSIADKSFFSDDDYRYIERLFILLKFDLKKFYKKEEREDIAISKNETINETIPVIKEESVLIKEELKATNPEPKIEFSSIEIADNDYDKYFDIATDKILSDLESYDKYYKISGLERKFSYTDLDIKKYGKQVIYRDMYFKKSLCAYSFEALSHFIEQNEYIKMLFDSMVQEDINSDVFGKELDIYLAGSKKNKNNTVKKISDVEALVLKYIFSIRTTFKDSLFKIFGTVQTQNQINFILNKLEDNGYIKMKLNKSTRITTVLSTNKLDAFILGTDLKSQRNKNFSDHGLLKERCKNDYVYRLVKESNPSTIEELEKVFMHIPAGMLYKGTDRILYEFYKANSDNSRFRLEYLYIKLSYIHSSLITTIRNLKKNTNPRILDNLYKTLIPLNDTLENLLEKVQSSISSFGKFNDFANISLRSLATNSAYIYDLKFKEDKEGNMSGNFKILFCQNVEQYKTSAVIYKTRDMIIYICSSTFETEIFCDNFDVFLYDDLTKSKFITNAVSIKNRIKDNKNYFYSTARTTLAKGLSRIFKIL